MFKKTKIVRWHICVRLTNGSLLRHIKIAANQTSRHWRKRQEIRSRGFSALWQFLRCSIGGQPFSYYFTDASEALMMLCMYLWINILPFDAVLCPDNNNGGVHGSGSTQWRVKAVVFASCIPSVPRPCCAGIEGLMTHWIREWKPKQVDPDTVLQFLCKYGRTWSIPLRSGCGMSTKTQAQCWYARENAYISLHSELSLAVR